MKKTTENAARRRLLKTLPAAGAGAAVWSKPVMQSVICLLYTSDAADE